MHRHLAAATIWFFLSACAPGPATPASAQEPRTDPLPGTKLSVDQLKAQMFHVSAGKRLKATWPNGAKVAVGLSFDVDNATAALSTGTLDYEILSRGEYGAVDGLPRILRMLDRQQVPASFFIPAASAALHPAMIKDIQGTKQRHEIGVHGWIHERLPLLNNEQEEQRLLNLSIDTLTKMTGRRPVGYRAPSWKFSTWTMGQVKAAGFLYDSSLMASDDPYEILLDGTPTGIVELPIERILDDAPYFGGNADGSMPSVSQVYEVFQSEFDVAYEEGGLYLLTMHPHYIGHRSRMAMLERLVQYIRKKPGVWFATHEQIANHVKPLIGGQ
ncbi:MAG TPA: polysaccharide deacetylase [Vicinamibacterales bacterium]|nr:polysaccharide deacetylase [Vicinamibacterales bacterium]